MVVNLQVSLNIGYFVAEKLVASAEGLCSVELIIVG
jgi:hypothetical protein